MVTDFRDTRSGAWVPPARTIYERDSGPYSAAQVGLCDESPVVAHGRPGRVGDIIGGQEPNPMPAVAGRQGKQHAGLVSSA